MSRKDDLFAELTAKGINLQELEESYKEAENFMKSKGVGLEQLEDFSCNRMQKRYKKIIFSPSKLFEGIVFGADRETDYGAKDHYDESVAAWKEDRAKAIAEGYCNINGEPIYHGKRKPKSGERLIKLDMDKGKPLHLVARCIEGAVDTEMRRTILVLRPRENGELIKDVPRNKLVKFRATISPKTNESIYILNSIEKTEFEVVDNSEISLKDIADKYLKNNICKSLKKLVDWHKAREEDPDRLVIIRGNIVEIKITNEGISNLITLDGKELGINDKPITNWIPEDEIINFDEEAMGVIIAGRTNLKAEDGDENVFVNAIAVWCPPEFRIEKKADDIVDQSKIKEQSVPAKPQKSYESKVEYKDTSQKPKESNIDKIVASAKKDDSLFADDDDVGGWEE